jgi:hypothetical protein
LNRSDYAEQPNPASDDMYWWHDGALEVIASTDASVQMPPALDAIVAANG